MKIISILLLLLCMRVYATTIEGLDVPLQFDKSYQSKRNFEDFYLNVLVEKWSFPHRTELGEYQKEKFERALAILEEVLNSKKFKERVLSYTRKDGKRLFQKNYLWDNSSELLTNEDVLEIILNGNEHSRPNTLSEMNINSYVKVCRFWEYIGTWCRRVIGSTNPHHSKWIKLNWKFYKEFEIPQMVNNLTHEWIHLLGFLHGKKNLHEEVPYVVGKIAGQVAAEVLEEKGF